MTLNGWVKISKNQTALEPPLSLRVCRNFGSRLRGFLFSPPPSYDQGLLFWYPRPSRLDTAIHMIGVPFPLAVIWLDQDCCVVDKRLARAWQIALIPKKAAQYIIECHPNRLKEFLEGDVIAFVSD